ncbi:unnamed protein product [Phaeothamnion confervicola]
MYCVESGRLLHRLTVVVTPATKASATATTGTATASVAPATAPAAIPAEAAAADPAAAVTCLALNPQDPRHVVLGSRGGVLRVWMPAASHGTPSLLAVDLNRQTRAGTGSGARKLSVASPHPILAVAFSARGDRIFVVQAQLAPAAATDADGGSTSADSSNTGITDSSGGHDCSGCHDGSGFVCVYVFATATGACIAMARDVAAAPSVRSIRVGKSHRSRASAAAIQRERLAPRHGGWGGGYDGGYKDSGDDGGCGKPRRGGGMGCPRGWEVTVLYGSSWAQHVGVTICGDSPGGGGCGSGDSSSTLSAGGCGSGSGGRGRAVSEFSDSDSTVPGSIDLVQVFSSARTTASSQLGATDRGSGGKSSGGKSSGGKSGGGGGKSGGFGGKSGADFKSGSLGRPTSQDTVSTGSASSPGLFASSPSAAVGAVAFGCFIAPPPPPAADATDADDGSSCSGGDRSFASGGDRSFASGGGNYSEILPMWDARELGLPLLHRVRWELVILRRLCQDRRAQALAAPTPVRTGSGPSGGTTGKKNRALKAGGTNAAPGAGPSKAPAGKKQSKQQQHPLQHKLSLLAALFSCGFGPRRPARPTVVPATQEDGDERMSRRCRRRLLRPPPPPSKSASASARALAALEAATLGEGVGGATARALVLETRPFRLVVSFL